MRIRLISDLHMSINENYPLVLDGSCDYTLIAGDLGPDFRKNSRWLRKNVKRGAFVSGNHDAYDREITIEDAKEFYHRKFPALSDVAYLDCSVGVVSKPISEKVLLVGDVLYTDYAYRISPMDDGLPEDLVVRNNITRASPKFRGSYMNDFNYFTRSDKYADSWEKDHPRKIGRFCLSPRHYLDHFRKAFSEIERIVESNPDKDVILMTHHCLSERCISREFSKDELNASYVSPRDKWIADHENIRLVLSGHVHHRGDFRVGNALYVLNPLGYCPYGENLEGENGPAFDPNLFVDTETWEIERHPYSNEKWERRFKADSAMMSMFL